MRDLTSKAKDLEGGGAGERVGHRGADIIPTLTPKMAEYIRSVVAQADVVDRKDTCLRWRRGQKAHTASHLKRFGLLKGR